MPLTRTRMKGDPLCRVRFTLPGERADGVAAVPAGEFNDRSVTAAHMKRDGSGSFPLFLVLPEGEGRGASGNGRNACRQP